MGALCLSLVPGQDLDTMEESVEIKVDTSISRTSRMQSYLAASGKRISSALSYVTGEMKECAEGLKGKASMTVSPDPAFQRSSPAVPQEILCCGSL